MAKGGSLRWVEFAVGREGAGIEQGCGRRQESGGSGDLGRPPALLEGGAVRRAGAQVPPPGALSLSPQLSVSPTTGSPSLTPYFPARYLEVHG